jgi:hypothetical protein
LAIAGLGALIDGAGWGLNKINSGQFTRKAVLDVLLAILVLAFAVWPVLKIRQEGLLSGEVAFEFDEYPQYDPNLRLVAAATVINLPENAIVFTDWDMVWPYYYTAYLENSRDDLAFIETYPADDQEQMATSLVEFVSDNLGKRPMFFESRPDQLATLENANIGPIRIGPSRFFYVSEVQQ